MILAMKYLHTAYNSSLILSDHSERRILIVSQRRHPTTTSSILTTLTDGFFAANPSLVNLSYKSHASH